MLFVEIFDMYTWIVYARVRHSITHVPLARKHLSRRSLIFTDVVVVCVHSSFHF